VHQKAIEREIKSMNDIETQQLHLTGRFTSAVDYARHLHIERRKGTGIPYMAHLLGVASLVMGEAGHAGFPVTEDMVIAAILHDAAEDHGGLLRLKDIEHNFGANVARMVEGLSDSLAEDPGNKQSWPERKQAYVLRLREEPADVQLISAADKLYNARAILEDYREIGPRIWERFKRGRQDQIRYFDELLTVYKSSGGSRIVGELERVVNELRQISAGETHS
jgi:(p)ppGpp synthase/HD superfamily hydrolase